MFRFRLLKANVGTFRALLLVCIACLLWFLCALRLVDDHNADMLSWCAAGVGTVLITMPAIRRHLLVYHMLISFVGIAVIGSSIYAKTLPIAQRDKIAWLILLVASFYLHSALWVYGSYPMPRTLREFLDAWDRRDSTSDVVTDSEDFENHGFDR